jgi:transcriptional regulator with XRE-family HTH domain
MAKLLLDRVLKRKKLSKRQFAKLLKTDYSYVFRYFRKGYDPRLSVLQKWATALKVKIASLYRDE